MSEASHRVSVYYENQTEAQKIDTDPRWKDYETLLSRPYFRRIWIVQEMVASRRNATIKCGQRTALLDDFYSTLRMRPSDLRYSSRYPYAHIDVIRQLSDQLFHGAILDAVDVLQRCRNSQASDLRDKLFAIYSSIHASLHSSPPTSDCFKLNYGLEDPEVYKRLPWASLPQAAIPTS